MGLWKIEMNEKPILILINYFEWKGSKENSL